VRNLTNASGSAEIWPVWSPDGRSIAYFSDRSGEYRLYVAPQEGMAKPREIALPEPSRPYAPAWSPDGRRIAYQDSHLRLWVLDVASGRATLADTDPHFSGLPAFLVREGGVNSGFMIAQVTAAALVSENKQLAHPASVDSIPTSANQEDHVSMATHGARRLTDMGENAANVLAIELLAAAQGIDFHRPMRTSEPLERVMAEVRARAASYDQDRYFAPDIAAVMQTVSAGAYRWTLPSGLEAEQ